MRTKNVMLAIALCLLWMPSYAHAQVMTLDQAIREAMVVNPQVRAARARWEAAQHQIVQAYTPSDPQFSFLNGDSWRGLGTPGYQNYTITQSLQFPGKGLLQGKIAKRTADISGLAYQATLRDVRAQVQTAYYQLQLDLALNDLIAANVASLEQVLKVTEISYTANLATQGDVINAKFALEAVREQGRQQAVTIANDQTALNVLLMRRAEAPLAVTRQFDLTGFEARLEQIIDLATGKRQEILEAALAQQNQANALKLAQLEYAPDYSVGFGFDHFIVANFAPTLAHTQDWNLTIAFNLPIFFWAKNEDVASAGRNLEAAREDLDSIRIQTAGLVTTTYRQILRSRETALLYRDTLIPLARQAFAVMLVAYQGGKADFTTLITTFQQRSAAQSTYLQAVNQLLAGKVALEQAAGGSLQ
jgi:cobalt-zinc-cadmium efflux system outer membrane protein